MSLSCHPKPLASPDGSRQDSPSPHHPVDHLDRGEISGTVLDSGPQEPPDPVEEGDYCLDWHGECSGVGLQRGRKAGSTLGYG